MAKKAQELSLSPEALEAQSRQRVLNRFKEKFQGLLGEAALEGYHIELFPGVNEIGRISVVTGIRKLTEDETEAFKKLSSKKI